VETGWKTPGVLAEELKKQFPEVVHAASYTPWEQQSTFAVGDKITKQTGHWAGADWFRMFSIPLLAGTPETALASPVSVAISRKVAEFYFGSPQRAYGKAIRIDNEKDFQVTAVFENLPAASSEKYEFLLNWQDGVAHHSWMSDWGNNGPQTRIELSPTTDAAGFEAKLGPFLKNYNKGLNAHFDIQLFLHPFQDGYLYANFTGGQQDGGRIEYIRLFSGVAVFILLIACINFMNLSTARSVKRAREVGIRKVIGAVRSLLIGQFMGEALLMTMLAVGVSLGVVSLLLPAFNSLTGKQLSLQITTVSFWALLLAITLLTGLVAGSYPALFLSSLNPVRVLKGPVRFGASAKLFRQGLVVFQFVLSMLLIIGTVVVYRQVNLLQNKNLGYQQTNLIYIPAEGELGKNYAVFKEQAQQLPGIARLSCMDEVPSGIGSSTHGVDWPGKAPGSVIEFAQTGVGYDFVETLKIQVKGRDFSRNFGQDSLHYLINEAAAKRIGYQDPIGQPLTLWGKTGKIIGVMGDFHFQSLHERIQPLIVRFDGGMNQKTILVSTKPGQTRQALQSLEKLLRKLNPAFPFSYQFADQEYRQLYQSETIVGNLTNYFAALAIFISCLGLFGLAAFTAEQHTKEIGVRKVLGASVISIVTLLSKDFLKLVGFAFVMAAPLAWYAARQWLENFAYKIGLEWPLFASAGLMCMLIALLTVSFQTIKAALQNPVHSLRSE
jgi:hypothetical protein